MFTGHFAAALAAKKIDSAPSLGITFMAAQWLDLLWPLLLLTGTEKVEINTDITAPVPLNFTDYPVSHSLLTVLGWSLLFGIIYFLFKKNWKSAVLIAVLVLSHWLLDLLVHIPDLPITPFTTNKVGLGLWKYKYPALIIELLVFAAGVYIYVQSTKPNNKKGSIGFWSLIIFLVVIQVMNVFGPPPPAAEPVAIMGLSQWLLVWWAWWADRNRQPVSTL
jgi:membrane-bound metal-dependent hydrolase YbcI (DUF457 family)